MFVVLCFSLLFMRLIKNSREELNNSVTVASSTSVRIVLCSPSLNVLFPALWVQDLFLILLVHLHDCTHVVMESLADFLSLWDPMFSTVLSTLLHKLSSILGMRCDPLGKVQIPPSPITVLYVKTLSRSFHGNLVFWSFLVKFFNLLVKMKKKLNLSCHPLLVSPDVSILSTFSCMALMC